MTRLRQERLLAALTQQELAGLSAVRQSTISKLELGGAPNVRFNTLARLARALTQAGRPVEASDLVVPVPGSQVDETGVVPDLA